MICIFYNCFDCRHSETEGARAGALAALIDIQADPVILSHLVVSLITAEAARNIRAAETNSDSAAAAAGQLPSEAQPLIRLLKHAQACLLKAQADVSHAPQAMSASQMKVSAAVRGEAAQVPSSVASPRGSKQKRKRESKAPPELSGIEPASNSASIEVGLQKKLRLNPSVEIRCIEGRWTTELQELADSIASTG